MADLNQVILIGRITADPELKHTTSNIPVTTFTIAINRRFAKEGQQQADFINIVAWRNTAEFICQYFKKGQAILIIGSIQTRSYEDKDGKKRQAVEVVANEVQFVEPKKDGTPNVSFSSGGNDDFQQLANDDELPF